MTNPYRTQPPRSFWKTAVADRHFADMNELWDPFPLSREDKVATAGSCFAQHIGRNLAIRGATYMDMEPAPPIFTSEDEARRFGFGVFSCRYGNIYTSRQLVQLAREALGQRVPGEIVWEKGGKWFDALRPGVEPVGHTSPDSVLAERKLHLETVRRLFSTLDVLVFTLGLTEGWESLADGTMFPTAPGTIAGEFREDRYSFRNLRHGEIIRDMEEFWELLKGVNPGARMLLTVSPVPLVATATGQHVLPSTIYSKSVLRAAAGDLAADHADIFYFPSYEIISSHPFRGAFFDPNLRTVNRFGVDVVMSHFFSGPLAREFAMVGSEGDEGQFDLICDEERLEENA